MQIELEFACNQKLKTIFPYKFAVLDLTKNVKKGRTSLANLVKGKNPECVFVAFYSMLNNF